MHLQGLRAAGAFLSLFGKYRLVFTVEHMQEEGSANLRSVYSILTHLCSTCVPHPQEVRGDINYTTEADN